VAVESSSLAYSISLDLLHIVGHLNVKKNTFYIADYLRFPGLNFGSIFSVTRYVVNAGLRGNGMHMTYATYMVYVVQKCSLYDGFVHTWKSTLSSGSQQLTSGFSGTNIGMAFAQLGMEGLKHLDKECLTEIDTL
jgi:hypothetical protein